MADKLIKFKLQQKKITIGSWITIGDTAIAEILANAGFDWLVIDLEHSCMDLQIASNLIQVIELSGVCSLVRITSNDSNQIKRVMDAGASGIIVPSVNSKLEAVRAVEATRYAPEGNRGVGLGRAQGYGAKFKEYLEWQIKNPIVVVMIENKQALPHLEEILTTSGVDAFLIGPYDLSCSLGIPGKFDDPIFIEALNFILATGKKVGCPTGIHVVEPDLTELDKAIKSGFNFIAYGVDIRMLDIAARQGALRKLNA
jgi:2-dehydro-3-deoxyglucarate aldolase